MELRHISLHGSSIGYRTAGVGPVVVLIHGMAGSSETWEPVIPLLAQHCIHEEATSFDGHDLNKHLALGGPVRARYKADWRGQHDSGDF